MELIERTRALILIGAEREVHAAHNTQHDIAVCAGMSEAMKIVKAAPTVDAVPVVRCGECDHWLPYEDEHREGYCKIGRGGNDDIDFCNQGTPRKSRMDADAPERGREERDG